MRPSDARPGSQDHYDVLGVSAQATPRQIARAYRALVRALHPDTATEPGDTVARFTAVTTAYAVLRDPVRRAAYDRSLHAEQTASPRDRDSADVSVPDNPMAGSVLIAVSVHGRAREPLLRAGPTRVSPLPRRNP